MKNFFVKKFTENDWREYRSIRLEASSKHPNFFSPYRDESKFNEEDWTQRLARMD